MNLATRFSQARKQKGLSQSELAARVGCAQSLVAKIERGGADRSKYMTEFAMELDVSPQWLATGKTDHVYLVRDDDPKGPTDYASTKAPDTNAESIVKFVDEWRRGKVSDADLCLVSGLVKGLTVRKGKL
jgi:transcriptional regulator with XRE-family HTH domain